MLQEHSGETQKDHLKSNSSHAHAEELLLVTLGDPINLLGDRVAGLSPLAKNMAATFEARTPVMALPAAPFPHPGHMPMMHLLRKCTASSCVRVFPVYVFLDNLVGVTGCFSIY